MSGLLFVALGNAAQAGAIGRNVSFGAALRLMLPGNVWLARKLVEMRAGLGLFNSCLLAREATRLDYRYCTFLVLSLVKAGPLDVSVEIGYVEPPATEFVAARRRGRRGGWSQAQSHETPTPTPSKRPATGKSILKETLWATTGAAPYFRSSRPPPGPDRALPSNSLA